MNPWVQPTPTSGFNPPSPGSTRTIRVQPAISGFNPHYPGTDKPSHPRVIPRGSLPRCTRAYPAPPVPVPDAPQSISVPNPVYRIPPVLHTISGVIITQFPIHGRVSGITHLNTRIAQYGHLTEVFFFLPERSLIAPHQRPAVLRRIPSQTCSLSFFASLPLLSNPFESSHHAHALLQTRPPLDLFFDRVDFLIDFILLDHCRASPEHHVIFKGQC